MPTSDTIAALRARIESIERRGPEGGLKPSAYRLHSEVSSSASNGLTFGLDSLDRCFGSEGLPCGAHQIAGAPGEGASALLFAALILARRFKADPHAQALVVQESATLAEAGALYGPGLYALGIDPGRLTLITARDGVQALRIVDEAMRSGVVSVVLTELQRGARLVDLPMTQRLNLYGQQTTTMALLLTPDLDGTTAAMTRWRARAAPSHAPRRYLGRPALKLELTRNRLGPVGRFTVEWSSDDERFRDAQTLRAPVVSSPVHRSDPPRPARSGFSLGLGGEPQRRSAAYGGR